MRCLELCTAFNQIQKMLKSWQVVISVIGAGGDCSFAVVSRHDEPGDPVDFRQSKPFSEIATLTTEIVDQVRKQAVVASGHA